MSELTPKEIRDRLRNATKLNLSPQEIMELVDMMHKHKSSAEVFSKEVNAMLKKPGRDRYIYSVKRIAGQEVAWTLKDDEGIIRTVDDEEIGHFHIWPFKEYAQKCVTGEWTNFKAHELSLDSLLNIILPNLSEEGTKVAVFMVPDGDSVSVSADDFLNNLLYERSQLWL